MSTTSPNDASERAATEPIGSHPESRASAIETSIGIPGRVDDPDAIDERRSAR